MYTKLLVEPLANGLILFYNTFGKDLGIAIILFSLVLRVVVYPLSKPYLDSMKKMKEYAPQLEKLKKRHKDDKIKLAQAQSEFYKQKGIKPGAGCLPQIIQIVILIAFFNVFTRTLNGTIEPTVAFNELLYEPLKFANGETLNTHFLYLDMAKPDLIKLTDSISIPGPILILAAFVQFVSAKITAPYERLQEKIAKKTKDKVDDFQSAMQKSMTVTLPFFTLIIGMKFPSGLALYWIVFSIVQAFQQYRSQGWGGLTPSLEKAGLIQSETVSKKPVNKKNAKSKKNK